MADPLALAEAFLSEAVRESRARQAAGIALASAGGAAPQCGLGVRAEVVLELSPRAAEIARELWPRPLAPAEIEAIRDVAASWIEEQDALDRKRNHFLKAFRQRHGSDRNAYAPAVLAEFERGLSEVNGEVDERRRAAASRLP